MNSAGGEHQGWEKGGGWNDGSDMGDGVSCCKVSVTDRQLAMMTVGGRPDWVFLKPGAAGSLMTGHPRR